MKLKLLLFFALLFFSIEYSNAQKSIPTVQLCNNYTCKVVDSFGCVSYKFKKECDLETIWNWGDGTNETTSKDKFVMHQYCKTGKYLVSIRLVSSPSIIRYSFYVYPVVDASIDFTFSIVSQTDCDKSIVNFQASANCIDAYDIDGYPIPGSEALEFDFGDGTTSRDLYTQHTYTSGGDYVVTLRAISSPCEFQKTLTVHLTDPVTCCLDNFNFTHTLWKPSGVNTYSNTTISVKKELHLYPGDYLQLNSVRLEMGKDAKIVIERGAKLSLNNSTITTTTCGGYVWEGIEVWGSGDNKDQDDVYGLEGKTGILKMDYSIIENADEAISVTKKLGLGFFEIDNNFNGGYINILNSTFRNNYTSINMWPYKACGNRLSISPDPNPVPIPCSDCNKYSNLSDIINNTFICNAPMRDARYTMTTDEGISFRLGISHFVYMNNTFNVLFNNNDFKNLYFTPPVQYRGTGVKLIHSNIEILQSVAVKGFRGLTVGVLSNADNSPCKTTSIIKNNFVNCQVAIDANSTKLNVSENVIYIPNTTAKLITQGIVTRGCRNFEIYNNSINGLSSGKKYGILLKNDRVGFAKNNNLVGLYTGTQSEALNEGIQINCNTYLNQNYSIVVPNGKIGTQGSKNYSAGNSFIDDCNQSSNNLNHIKSSSLFKYYFGGKVFDFPFCRSSIVLVDNSTNNSFCVEYNSNPCPPVCTKDNYVQRINSATAHGDFHEVVVLKSEMANELLSMEGGYDVYLSYLDSISATDLEAAKLLASTYLTEEKYIPLEEKLNLIQQSETEEGSSFVNLINLLKEAQIEGRNINELTGEEVLQLNNLAQNDTTTASYMAEGLLYQIYGYEYDHNPFEMELGNRLAQNEELINDDIQLYPNPVKESINITSRIENIKGLKIYNMIGALVYSSQVNDKSSSINIQNLPSGIYYAKLELENSTISRKFIIE